MSDVNEASVSSKLGIFGLAAIVVSSMIGGGIFSLPQNMAQSAAAGSVILAWLITGIGMYFIANTFRILSNVKPDLTSGIYMYAKEGFGPFMGFNIGWSYWLCQIFGNVGYAVITMDALNYFFPGVFQGGNNLNSIIGGSLLIWFFNFLVLRGVKQAAFINLVVTIAKIVPLVLFIIISAAVFNFDKFDFDFWGQGVDDKLGPISEQIKNTMLVTLWAFIGIEGAVVLSGRAQKQSDVGKATLIGFLGCLVIYVLLSILPFGLLSQAELARIPNPSTAGVLEHIIGKGGSYLMNIGMIVAILASWLSWTMIVAEMPHAMAKNGAFPQIFAAENKNGSPDVSLWVTSFLMQLVMVLVYFSSNAWNTMLSITGVMVLPAYFMSALYLWKICEDHEFLSKAGISRFSALVTGFLGTIYSLWLIYAAGLSYLLMAVIFIALGIPLYMMSRYEQGAKFFANKHDPKELKMFDEPEKALCVIIIVTAFVALYAFSHKLLTL
ncbi:MAG: amino acid permease [Alphaproteobacteria bacterium]|nr:amino acid permease [Alphaproteobacteria bacterium]